jgi:hypothetical protein
MSWGREMRGFFSARAYSWFLASECASRAAKSRAGFKIYAEITNRFLFEGCPTPRSAAMLTAFLALPAAWRERLRDLAVGHNRSTTTEPRKNVTPTLGMEL